MFVLSARLLPFYDDLRPDPRFRTIAAELGSPL